MSQFEPFEAEPIPLSVRTNNTTSSTGARRKQWSAPPPPMAHRRSRWSTVLFSAMWIAIGAASIAYVAQRAHDNVATSDAR